MDADSSGYIFLGIAIIGWGASAPLIELGLQTEIGALSFLTYRFLLATLILTPYVIIYRRDIFVLFRHPLVWLVGISEALGLIFQYLGQQLQVPAGLAALLSLLFLLIVPFLSPIFLDETLQKQHLLAVAVALVGVLLISSEGDFVGLLTGKISPVGVILLLLAALGYAFYLVFTSKLRREQKEVDTFGLFYTVMVMITLCSGITTAITQGFTPPPATSIVWLILLVFISTLVAFVSYFEAMKTVSANLASVLLLLQVFVAFFLEFLFLTAEYNQWIIAGSALILVAMYLAVTTKTPTKEPGEVPNHLTSPPVGD